MVKKALGPIIEETKDVPEGVTIEFNEAYLEQKLAEKCGYLILCANIKEVEALCGNLSSTYLFEALTKRVTELEKQVEKNFSDTSWSRVRTKLHSVSQVTSRRTKDLM